MIVNEETLLKMCKDNGLEAFHAIEGLDCDTDIILITDDIEEIFRLCKLYNEKVIFYSYTSYQPDDRIETIKKLVADVEKTEMLLECNNTIIIGDFNASPYDKELLSKFAFNAVLFKTIIEKSELTNPSTLKRKRFYNPILHYISENTEMYGSFYYEKNSDTPYWYCLDQMLVRKSLANSVNHMEYLKKINEKDLLKNRIPNREISDHLPLLVNLLEVGNGV